MTETRRPVSQRIGHVYFASDGEVIKIGFATYVARRVGNLRSRTGRNLKLLLAVPGWEADERAIHSRIFWLTSHGKEWYRPEPPLLEFIERLRAASGSFTASRTLAHFIAKDPLRVPRPPQTEEAKAAQLARMVALTRKQNCRVRF